MVNSQLFKRMVQIGRVVLLINGDFKNRIAVIVEILDCRRVVLDGPKTCVSRHIASCNDFLLTSIMVHSLAHGARTGIVAKRWDAQDITAQWNKTTMAKKLLSRQRRAQLNDFERFQVMLLKKQRRIEVAKTLSVASL
ncbi:uncharacterized protein T551_02009 [Pneumocystis jirovecii RU7]|uniref:Large ribosomal subunit protein eL14 domain-containing protein n=1 Tax=Pneumocystis jirovecii (strain RU7) TaxID=1408657 RepID=A0A0W4ZNY6_PNEJ7|nr:uncharacterized protein T551_02009 [Pneumocystis jirovecii RU7]KTW30065.1 hypothetical protein T551_02009 [Pneumocystis jirovecii RU7]